jgi:hypothetical protein
MVDATGSQLIDHFLAATIPCCVGHLFQHKHVGISKAKAVPHAVKNFVLVEHIIARSIVFDELQQAVGRFVGNPKNVNPDSE